MRDFETYFQIFLVRHKNDKNFPLLSGHSITTEESIQTLKDYFEDFWNESQKNFDSSEYENKIQELREEIFYLEEKF